MIESSSARAAKDARAAAFCHRTYSISDRTETVFPEPTKPIFETKGYVSSSTTKKRGRPKNAIHLRSDLEPVVLQVPRRNGVNRRPSDDSRSQATTTRPWLAWRSSPLTHWTPIAQVAKGPPALIGTFSVRANLLLLKFFGFVSSGRE